MAPHFGNQSPIESLSAIIHKLVPRIQLLKRSSSSTNTSTPNLEKDNELLHTVPGKVALFGAIFLGFVVLIILVALLFQYIAKQRKDPSSRFFKRDSECPWTPTYEVIETPYNSRNGRNFMHAAGGACPELVSPTDCDNDNMQSSLSYDPGLEYLRGCYQENENAKNELDNSSPIRTDHIPPAPTRTPLPPPSQALISHSRSNSRSSQNPSMFSFVATPRATSSSGINNELEKSSIYSLESRSHAPTPQTTQHRTNFTEYDIDTSSVKRASQLNRHSSYHSNWGSPLSISSYYYSSIRSQPASVASSDCGSSIASEHAIKEENVTTQEQGKVGVHRSVRHMEARERLIDERVFENIPLVDEADEHQGAGNSATSPQISRAFSF